MSVIPDMKSSIELHIGSHRAQVDGLSSDLDPNEWAVLDYMLPAPLHLQVAEANWMECHAGDYMAVVLVHPLGDTTLQAATLVDDTVINVGASKAPYYNPAIGCQWIEFWNSDFTELYEMRPVASISGAEVTLTEGVAFAHPTTVNVRAVFNSFVPIRGANNIEAGLRIVGSGSFVVENTHTMTDIIPAGMCIAVKIRTTIGGTKREFGVNFIFREPAP